MKRIPALFLVLVCTMMLLPMQPAQAATDSINIVSITPDAFQNYKDAVTFTVEINYSLQSADAGIVYLGFNTVEPQRYRLVDDSMVVSKGVGTCTLTGTVTPAGWGTPSSPSGPIMGGLETINGDVFGAYVNISNYPHEESWTPLATDIVPLRQGTPTKTMGAPTNESGASGPASYDIYKNLPRFYFGPGVGACETILDISPDGSFTGYYSDSDMGVTGPGYPNGTRYECRFSGRFSGARRIGEFEYLMNVESIEYEKPFGDEEIIDGVLVVYDPPYGFTDADEIRLYLPGKATADLSEDFMDWVWRLYMWDVAPSELPFYGLYNIGARSGFAGELPSSPEPTPQPRDELTRPYTITYPTDDFPAKSDAKATIPVQFGASLFKKPASAYDHDMALLAAALTACTKDRAQFLARDGGAYEVLGFKDDEYYNYLESNYTKGKLTVLPNSTQSEQCFSIASRKMVIDGKEQTVIAVLMRGTDTWWEGLNDWLNGVEKFKNSDYMVYRYFLEYADKAWNALNDYLKEYKINTTNARILIGGHSLGGSAANLLAARLQMEGGLVHTSRVYAYTFGALNTLEWPWGGLWKNQGAEDNARKARGSDFSFIHNIFNFYDTFGTEGAGTAGVIPTYGDKTSVYKFGRTMIFSLRYTGESGHYKDHNMPCYISAIDNNLPLKQGRTTVRALCPVDIEVYDSANALVGRTVNNVLDESVTSVPMYVVGNKKFLLLPNNEKYSLKITAYNEGNMSYYVESVGDAQGEVPIQEAYENILLVPNKVMSSAIGESSDISLFVLDSTGTSVAEIQPDGTEIQLMASTSPPNALTPTPQPATIAPELEPTPEPAASSAVTHFPVQPILITIAVLCVIGAAVLLFIRNKEPKSSRSTATVDGITEENKSQPCAKCGRELPAHAAFCAFCGQKLD